MIPAMMETRASTWERDNVLASECPLTWVTKSWERVSNNTYKKKTAICHAKEDIVMTEQAKVGQRNNFLYAFT